MGTKGGIVLALKLVALSDLVGFVNPAICRAKWLLFLIWGGTNLGETGTFPGIGQSTDRRIQSPMSDMMRYFLPSVPTAFGAQVRVYLTESVKLLLSDRCR